MQMKIILPMLSFCPFLLKTNLKHFNNFKFEKLLPSKKSFITFLFLLSSITISSLTEHSQHILLVFKSYPLYVQPSSHKGTFSKKSFFLSDNKISVPLSEVNEEHIS